MDWQASLRIANHGQSARRALAQYEAEKRTSNAKRGNKPSRPPEEFPSQEPEDKYADGRTRNAAEDVDRPTSRAQR
jgi:hypothetical protein